jgi:hypothetical protein
LLGAPWKGKSETGSLYHLRTCNSSAAVRAHFYVTVGKRSVYLGPPTLEFSSTIRETPLRPIVYLRASPVVWGPVRAVLKPSSKPLGRGREEAKPIRGRFRNFADGAFDSFARETLRFSSRRLVIYGAVRTQNLGGQGREGRKPIGRLPQLPNRGVNRQRTHNRPHTHLLGPGMVPWRVDCGNPEAHLATRLLGDFGFSPVARLQTY